MISQSFEVILSDVRNPNLWPEASSVHHNVQAAFYRLPTASIMLKFDHVSGTMLFVSGPEKSPGV